MCPGYFFLNADVCIPETPPPLESANVCNWVPPPPLKIAVVLCGRPPRVKVNLKAFLQAFTYFPLQPGHFDFDDLLMIFLTVS